MLTTRCFCLLLRALNQTKPKSFTVQQIAFSTWYRSGGVSSLFDLYSRKPCILTQELTQKRTATKKAKQKKKAAVAQRTPKINTSIGEGVIDMKVLQSEMEEIMDQLRYELTVKYSIKFSIGALDDVRMLVRGDMLKLMEVAEVKLIKDEFTVSPMLEVRNIQKIIVDGIIASGLDLNPRVDGNLIKITMPKATTQFKVSLLKLCKESTESTKTSLRKLRQQVLTKVKKKSSSLGKDELKEIEKQVDVLTKSYSEQIDSIYNQKENELK